MRRLTALFFYGYVAMLLSVGGAGLFVAEWELQAVFHVDLGTMTGPDRATLLNQYRFLKGMEFGFGLFSLYFRHEIFRRLTFNRLFLATLFIGVGARMLSMVMDGIPHAAFIAFTLLELLTGVFVFLHTHTALERHDRLAEPSFRQSP